MFESKLKCWLDGAAQPSPDPAADVRALHTHAVAGEVLLAQLPCKSMRTKEQQDVADLIHRSCRHMRKTFLAAHVSWAYHRLTQGRTLSLRVAELADLASRMFPGLVPDSDQLAQERRSFQVDKEAREIDQGIFFSAVLGDPVCGAHLIESMLKPTLLATELLPAFRREGRCELATVTLERRDGTAYLTVNNQGALNAEDDQLIADMESAVDLALLDDQVSVAVVRGAEMTHTKYAGRRVFSAGINLKHLHQGKISFVDFLLRRELGYINKILRGLVLAPPEAGALAATVEKPWIAAIDTFAIGGGAQLVLVFDRVIAESDSYFSLPAAQEGIVPGVANLRLWRAVGARLSRQIILFGHKIKANEPDARLLFDEVVAATDMNAAIEANAALLDSAAVIANRRMLTLAEEPIDTFRSYMSEFAMTQSYRMYSPDVLEKVAPTSNTSDKKKIK